MAEPFKNLFNPTMIAAMGNHLQASNPSFNKKLFIKNASNGLDSLELKARAIQIQTALDPLLPTDFRAACEMILGSLSPKTDEDWLADDIHTLGISGWAIMPLAEIVAARGLSDFDYAMNVLAQLTKRFTSEFAVRPFFLADENRAVEIACDWARDDNYHVRRLASEGSRPRLPWGLRLQNFVTDPTPLIPLLETLRDDPSEYVRRSVANSLNDIAKDHPDKIAGIATDWLIDASKERTRLIKHACRSLIKSGHAPTLAALGYGPPKLKVEPISLDKDEVQMGESIGFSVSFESTAKTSQSLIVDYVVHHQKANGTTTPKTFKWKTIDLAKGETVTLNKTHMFKNITTRTYHNGEHALELQVNGVLYGKACFNLVV